MSRIAFDTTMASLPGSSAIREYLQEIKATPLLKASEEKELAVLVQQGDPEARDLLIRANLRLVVNVARHFVGRGVSLEDLVEEGNLGLMRAVESFDPAVSTRFSTYAVYWIRQSMRRALINQARTVRLPAYLVNLLSKCHRASARLTEKLGRTPTDTEIVDALKLGRRKREVVIVALELIRALPASAGGQSDSEFSVEEIITDMRAKPVEEQVYENDCLNRLFKSIDMLDTSEAEVVRLRFGLIEAKPLSLVETAQNLGLTRERVRVLEKRAMEQLRWLSRCVSY